MAKHYLKSIEPYYSDVEQGYKNFEVRKNDRPFDIGDMLILQQYIDGKFTGKEIRRKIKYILFDENFVKERFCILGLAEPEPRALTHANIQARGGLPIFLKLLDVPGYSWSNGCWVFLKTHKQAVNGDTIGYIFDNAHGEFNYHAADYGKIWLAYDKPPKED